MTSNGFIGNWFKDNWDYTYVIARAIVAIVFFIHGTYKLFGWFGAKSVAPLFSLFGLGGVIETVVAVLLFFGLFTRLGALLGALEMAYVWFFIHIAKGVWNPLANGGEPAVLFFCLFIIFLALGARKCSLDKVFFNKEVF